jgi:hypothetical protein
MSDAISAELDKSKKPLDFDEIFKKKKFQLFLKRIFDFNSNGVEYGGENAFKYLIGEMVTNIYEHSMFNNALVMAQKYATKKYVDICFCDNGISIPGSFERAGMFFEDDFEAIGAAINGTSSKMNHERGWGMGSSARICLEGLGGSMLIASRGGTIEFHQGNPKRYIDTDRSDYRYSGTLISMRFPYPAPEVDVYEFTG